MKHAYQYRKHSADIGHQKSCPCPVCKSARSVNLGMIKAGYRKAWTHQDLRPVAQRIVAAVGNVTDAAQWAGITKSAMYSYLKGSPTKTAQPRVVARLLACDVSKAPQAPTYRYSARQFIWRLNVLRAHGYPLSYIGHRMGLSYELSLGAFTEHVKTETWDALETIWEDMISTTADATRDGINPRSIARAKSTAAKAGFACRDEYENEFDEYPAALDPEVQASVRAADAERVADIDRAVERRVRAGGRRDTILIDLQGIYTPEEIIRGVERINHRISRQARAKSQAEAA